jgi:hypothetical protein
VKFGCSEADGVHPNTGLGRIDEFDPDHAAATKFWVLPVLARGEGELYSISKLYEPADDIGHIWKLPRRCDKEWGDWEWCGVCSKKIRIKW